MTLDTISVCIATHDRAELLAATLECVGRQTEPPAEVLVSEFAQRPSGRRIVESFAAEHPEVKVRYLPAERRSLPWHRWWAFSHSSGSVALFMDDDIELHPRALEMLKTTYADMAAAGRQVDGVGFVIAWSGGGAQERSRFSRREKWLRIHGAEPGTVTAGGITVSLAGFAGTDPEPVEVLSGGAMSYRREILEKVGCLKNLVALYDSGMGRGEDAVLSFYARKCGGQLFALPGEWTFHPRERQGARPYAADGWRLGMAHTWGRAHTMRWMATARNAYCQEWGRLAILELARSAAGIAASPLDGQRWKRIGGAFWGIGRSLVHWRQIPADAH